MSFVISRSSNSSIPSSASSRDDAPAEASAMGRTCLAAAFLVVILCMILKTSGAHTPWMGGLLGLSAGLVSAFVFLGWQEFADDLARHMRKSAARR
jgi:hypothetical protein